MLLSRPVQEVRRPLHSGAQVRRLHPQLHSRFRRVRNLRRGRVAPPS
jgi:hypothetical protein